MKNDVNHILIETTIRTTLTQLQDDPERSIRNLVDMALHFSAGRFQHRFFKIAQDMLQNEQSCYYKILPDIVANVDKERILTFGMNIGYNSCTVGAGTIRKTEEAEQFNIPWSISLKMNGIDYVQERDSYHLLISQGKNLGIYTWNIFSMGNIPYLIEMIHHFPECAFIVFCTPEEIFPALLDELNTIYNLMFVIQYTNGIEDACELLSDTENLHPVFTVLLADTLFIDSIISDEACSIGFNHEGICYSLIEQSVDENLNFFNCSLCEILKKVCPQKKFIILTKNRTTVPKPVVPSIFISKKM